MAHPEYDPDLNHLGRQLRGLSPRPCPLDRDAVMFRAGQASVPRNWLWPAAAALSTCLAATFGAALLVQPAPRVQVAPMYLPQPSTIDMRPGYAPAPVPEPPDEETVTTSRESGWVTPDTEYFHLQNDVLRRGLDGLPPTPPAAPPRTEKRNILIRSF